MDFKVCFFFHGRWRFKKAQIVLPKPWKSKYNQEEEEEGESSEIELRWKEMFRRSKFLSFPMVIGAVIIGVVSGKAIFGPPLDDYWRKKLQEEADAEEKANSS